MTAMLELGLTPWRYDASARAPQLTEQAVRAEALGYHSFWLPESRRPGGPVPLGNLTIRVIGRRNRA